MQLHADKTTEPVAPVDKRTEKKACIREPQFDGAQYQKTPRDNQQAALGCYLRHQTWILFNKDLAHGQKGLRRYHEGASDSRENDTGCKQRGSGSNLPHAVTLHTPVLATSRA